MVNMEESKIFQNIRSNFGTSFDDYLVDTYDVPVLNDRWTGYVIDNKDPKELGRVKVRIIGKYDDMDEPTIPWAIIDVGYLGSTYGNFVIPEIGTGVRGYFDHGDIHKPIVDAVVFHKANPDNSKAKVGGEDYPNIMILMQTDQGECLTLNRVNGETKFTHRTGAVITITTNGTINIESGINDADNPGKIILYTQKGDIKIESDEANIDITTNKGNINVDSENGQVNLGKNSEKRLVNNFPKCLVTGADHFVGVTNVNV